MTLDDIENRIDSLAALLRSARGSARPDWKPVWDEVRFIGSMFKQLGAADQALRQKAWGRFQSLVDDLKDAMKQDTEKRRSFAEESARHLRHVSSLTQAAEPPDALAEMILMAVTGGASLLISATLEAVLGKHDEVTTDLKRRGELLREAGLYLGRHKSQMRGADKAAAFEAIKAQRDRLDSDWEKWKRTIDDAKAVRHREYLERQSRREEWQRKQQEWRQRQLEFVSRLESSIDRLMDAREKRRQHLRELEQKLSDAWSDSYRSRIGDWIAEEERNIEEIDRKLAGAADKLAEAKGRL